MRKKIFARNFNPIWKSFAVLIVGLIFTFGISSYFQQEEESQSNKEFVLVCNEVKTKILAQMNLQSQFMLSGSSFFEASKSVSRKEWQLFNKFSRINENFIGVQGFGFATIIKKDELKNHVSAIRKEGFPKYTVYPQGERDLYTSVIFIEPFDQTNAMAFGFDMLTDPIRRKAMEESRDLNIPTLSGKVVLRQKAKKGSPSGIIMFAPVYKNTLLNTIADRRVAISGWVYSPFRMDDLMKSILGRLDLYDKTKIRLQIYDDVVLSSKNLLFDSQKEKLENAQTTKNRTQVLPVLFNKKRWTLVFSQPSENGFFLSAKTLITLIGGTIISFLLFALSYSLLVTKQRARIIAERLNQDLFVKNREYERMNKSLSKNYKKLIDSKEKLKETNFQLQKAIVKAKESDQLKSAFLANMSHEIRTPMNGIVGFAELLKEDNLSKEEQKKYIEIIEKSGIRLLNIINDIVDISKIEAGQMNVSFSTTNVDEQMQYIHTFFLPETQDKGIQLILKKLPAAEETIISSDCEKLYAILINLVKNAIKFTVKGTIEFGYDIKGDYIEFFVKDTGIGISKDRQQAIFERFIQADFNDKMARQGTGLGLAIAKAYVELLGGKIWVKSEPGKGSKFYFTLPNVLKPETKSVAQNIKATHQDMEEIKNLKILVTEDDKISRILILKVLEEFGNHILTAQTGLEAVEICRNNPNIDLILMDMQMPQMNGYEATKEIRKFNQDVVILAQTAFALEGDKAKTIEAGCNGYISKPIKKEELANLLQYYFGKAEKLG